jgi:dTDP-L-rhamnose 4-epimerase
MRVLVTGGAGFVGSHVVGACLGAGHEVRVLDLAPGADGRASADVRDPAACDAALAVVDVVVHQAAKVGLGVDVGDLPAYASHNDLGTAVLLAAMARAQVSRLVLASSMVVYGEGAYSCPVHGSVSPGQRLVSELEAGRFEPTCPECEASLTPELVGEDASLDPRNAYAATKVAQEHLASAWARATGGTAVMLRYHNVYGPLMPRDTPYAGVASLFRSALARGEAPNVYEDGGQRRDFVHVSDVAAANLAAVGAGAELAPGTVRAYNVGSGTPHTVGEMATELAVAHGEASGQWLEPAVTGEFRLGDVRHVTASSARAVDELGWKALVAFEEGVRAFASDPLGPP